MDKKEKFPENLNEAQLQSPSANDETAGSQSGNTPINNGSAEGQSNSNQENNPSAEAHGSQSVQISSRQQDINDANDKAIKTAMEDERPRFTPEDGALVASEAFGTRVLPVSTYLFMEEKEADLDLLVSVPAAVETRLLVDHFEHRLVSDIDEVQHRIMESTYSLQNRFEDSSSAMQRLSQDILMEVIKYLAKFKDYVGLSYTEGSSVDTVEGILDVNQAREAQVYKLGRSTSVLHNLLKSAGFTDEEVANVLRSALDSLDRYFIRNTFNPAVMRFSLENELSEQVRFDALKSAVQLTSMEESIRTLQDLYAFAATTTALDSIGNRIVNGNSTAQTLSTIVALRNMFARYNGPVTVQKLNKVVSSSLQSMGFETSTYEYSGDQLLHANMISAGSTFDMLGDKVNRLQLMRFYLAGLAFYSHHFDSVREAYFALSQLDPISEMRSAYQSLATSLTDPDHELGSGSASITSLLSFYLPGSMTQKGVWSGTHPDLPGVFDWSSADNEMRFDVNTVAGGISQDHATKDEEAFEILSSLFSRLVARFLISNLASGNDGLFKMRIKGLIDERALQRSETWDFVVDASLSADSVCFQSFLDAFAYMKRLAEDEVLHFKLDTCDHVRLLKTYFSTAVTKYDVSVLPALHPSSIYETALVVRNSVFVKEASNVMDKFDVWALSDGDLAKDGNSQVFDPIQDRYSNYYFNPAKGAGWMDLPTSFPLPVYYYGLRKQVSVRHFIKEEIPAKFQLDTQLGEFIARHPNFSSLTSLGLNSLFVRPGSGELTVFLSVDDVATRLGIPRPYAEELWRLGLQSANDHFRYIYSYTGPLYSLVEIPEQYVPFRRFEKVIGNGVVSTAFVPEPYELQRTYSGWFGYSVPDLTKMTGSRPTSSVITGTPEAGLTESGLSNALDK